MSQDKYIERHQENIEVLREQVRERKEEILSKIDVNELLRNPSEYLQKIGTDFYADNSDKIKASINSGEKLANKILKTTDDTDKNEKS
tara:strand:+ start:1413 stop:1676 length:264 start_codon:yes stop_codon:yes gene_type:complete